jgi:hypothetical protein
MLPASIFEDLTPHARVATAIAPFVVASVLRVALGKNRLTKAFLSLSTLWFTVSVFMAPYSQQMQQDVIHMEAMFR